MNLLALQRDMRGWLTREDVRAARRIGPHAAPGLRVYQNSYRAQLMACLEASFARTLAWIGHDAFRAAAATHIDATPPSSWTLDAYARDFPATLAGLFVDDPEVAELAALELALEEVFVGPDADPLGVADMADVDWNRVVLRLAPALDLVATHTNAAAIWSALAAGEAPPGACHLDEPEAALVWRQNDRARFRGLDQFEWQALIRARSGMPFAMLCDETARAFGDDAAAMAGGWLGRWIADGLIVGFVEPD
ncbi:DNA-binding domain-containing protein [Sphingomonas sp. KR1UV-12]|uniref:DNA-binding domain-containing protein n=1 Tax=Sphingomonas aurea TaxID=3063994 RepID=A0ABT9EJ40_9SPHN|nr:DNA-binding domain-containing protein [Sphingomonas sp. KR1UV-12]MDP1026836.1 DNA-binding domain-containing protein [Sphingomonas sp. KR1UV-12]